MVCKVRHAYSLLAILSLFLISNLEASKQAYNEREAKFMAKYLEKCESSTKLRHITQFDPNESALRNCMIRRARSTLSYRDFTGEQYAVGAAQSVFDNRLNRGAVGGMAGLAAKMDFVDIACQV